MQEAAHFQYVLQAQLALSVVNTFWFLAPFHPFLFYLQVALHGSLVPLPQEQVQLLKARCGHGGLRVPALANKNQLLHQLTPPPELSFCRLLWTVL
jgi:hypothetical protein